MTQRYFDAMEDEVVTVPYSYLVATLSALLVEKYGPGEIVDSTTTEDLAEQFIYQPEGQLDVVTVTVGPAYLLKFDPDKIEQPVPNNYNVFEDRAMSLLERWRYFLRSHPGVKPSVAINGFLQEVNDSYTHYLVDMENKGQ